MSSPVPLPGSPLRVLILTSKPALAEAIRLALNHGACVARVSGIVEQASALVKEWRPHIIILDMELNGGANALESLGQREALVQHVPIIAVTQRGDLKSKLQSFDRGADDILTLPFAPEELLARVVAVVRRTYRIAMPLIPAVSVGDVEVNIVTREASAGGHLIPLTALEMALLYLLMANAGKILSRDEIQDNLWGSDYSADSNVVDRHIRNLRIKLKNHADRPKYIFTTRGQGYSFKLHPKPQ